MPFDVSVPSLGLGLMVHGDGWELLAGALYCWFFVFGWRKLGWISALCSLPCGSGESWRLERAIRGLDYTIYLGLEHVR